MKICKRDAGHMTKMAAMPIYSRKLKKSSSPAGPFSLNKWYVASGTPAHHSLHK